MDRLHAHTYPAGLEINARTEASGAEPGRNLSFSSPTPATIISPVGQPREHASSVQVPKQVDSAKERALEARQQLLEFRIVARKKRRHLRYQRGDLSAADSELLNVLRITFVKLGSVPNEVLASYNKRERLRDEYVHLEDEYDEFEDRLEEQELVVEDAEQQWSETLPAVGSESRAVRTDKPALQVNGTGQYENHQEQKPSTNRSPDFDEYLSRLGDANLIKEELSDLLLSYSAMMEREHDRQVVRLPIPGPDLDSWQDWEFEWSQSIEKLERVEAEVEVLGQKAREDGLLLSPRESISSEDYVSVDETEIAASKCPEPTAIVFSVRERVNRWFQSIMRASIREAMSFEVRLHREQVEKDSIPMNEDEYVKVIEELDEVESTSLGEPTGSTTAYTSGTRRPAKSKMVLQRTQSLETTRGHQRTLSRITVSEPESVEPEHREDNLSLQRPNHQATMRRGKGSRPVIKSNGMMTFREWVQFG